MGINNKSILKKKGGGIGSLDIVYQPGKIFWFGDFISIKFNDLSLLKGKKCMWVLFIDLGLKVIMGFVNKNETELAGLNDHSEPYRHQQHVLLLLENTKV